MEDPATHPPPEALARLEAELTACRACPRLVAWREQVAVERRAAFRDEEYWARPVPGFGDPEARMVIVGLAPAAHGANRTGRMFTGDRSGTFLYAALWRTGLANQPTSVSRDDGLALTGVWITAPVRCAPPANKPTPGERDRCRPWMERELGPAIRRSPCRFPSTQRIALEPFGEPTQVLRGREGQIGFRIDF